MNARHNAEKHAEKTGEPLPDDYQVSIEKLVSPRNAENTQNPVNELQDSYYRGKQIP